MFSRKKKVYVSLLTSDLEADLEHVRDGGLLMQAEIEGRRIGREDPEAWSRELEQLIRDQNQSTNDAATDAEQLLADLDQRAGQLEAQLKRTEERYKQLSTHPVTGRSIETARLKPNAALNFTGIALLFLVDIVATTRMASFIFALPLAWALLVALGLAIALALLGHLVMDELHPIIGEAGPTRYRIFLGAIAFLYVVAVVTFGVMRGTEVARLAGLSGTVTTLFYVTIALAPPLIAAIVLHRYKSRRALVKPLLDSEAEMEELRAKLEGAERARARLIEWLVDLPQWHRDRIGQLVSRFTSACDWGFVRRGKCLGIFTRKSRAKDPRPWNVDKTQWPQSLRDAYDAGEALADRLEQSYARYQTRLASPGAVATQEPVHFEGKIAQDLRDGGGAGEER